MDTLPMHLGADWASDSDSWRGDEGCRGWKAQPRRHVLRAVASHLLRPKLAGAAACARLRHHQEEEKPSAQVSPRSAASGSTAVIELSVEEWVCHPQGCAGGGSTEDKFAVVLSPVAFPSNVSRTWAHRLGDSAGRAWGVGLKSKSLHVQIPGTCMVVRPKATQGCP